MEFIRYTKENEEDAVPLGEVKVRWENLNSSSTPYERAIAAPSDSTLHTMWLALSFVNLTDSIVVAVCFVGIILNRKVRKNPFNLYLLFLMFPDWCFGFFCFLTCIMCYAKGEFWSPAMCKWQSVYLVFGTVSNTVRVYGRVEMVDGEFFYSTQPLISLFLVWPSTVVERGRNL